MGVNEQWVLNHELWSNTQDMHRLTYLILGLISSRLIAQSLSPPPQDFILGFSTASAAYTTSPINLGTSFTMECWVSLDAASPYSIIMGKAYSSRGTDPYMNYIIGLDQAGTSLAFVQSTGQAGTYTQITAPLPVPFHTWTHVAGVLDTGTMKLYINGQLVASGRSPGATAGTDVPFALGGGFQDSGNPQSFCCSFDGVLRQARVWSRALPSAEVQSYASQTLTGGETGLVADWPLDDGSGSPHDIGPQHLDLTLAGAVAWANTSLYNAGPYWDYRTFQTDNQGYGTGTVVDMDVAGLTAISAYQQSVTVSGSARAFRWTKSGMADVTAIALPNPAINVLSPRDWAVADFDGDGRLDVFLASHGLDQSPFPGGQSHIFIQNAAGQLVDETSARIPIINNFTHTVAAADIDGDGDIDLYMGNIGGGTTGPLLYMNDGTGHFTPRTAGLPAAVASRTQVFTSARFLDVNNDGSPDLILGSNHNTDHNVVLLNDGLGNFSIASNVLPPKFGGLGWESIAISPADYDGDGYTDLIFSMTDNYQGHSALQLLLNNGDGTFRDASSQIPQDWPVVPASGGQLNGSWIQWVMPCDINGDGWIDLVTVGGANLIPRLFVNQGNAQFVDATEVLPAKSLFGQVLPGDFDGDGRADLFFDFDGGSYGFARNLKAILPAQTRGTGVRKPLFTAGGITNAASFQTGSIAPGEIVTIFGSHLGPSQLRTYYLTDGAHLSRSISGTRVLFNGVPGPLIYTSDGQVSAIVPYALAGLSTATVQLEYNLVKSDPVTVSISATAPGLFEQNAAGAGAILNQDGSLNTPANPAAPGSTVVLFGTGEGQTSPPGVDGEVGVTVFPKPDAPVSVTIGGIDAHVDYAGAAPDEVAGVLQINVDVPLNVASGVVPVVVKIGNATSQTNVIVSVR